MSIKIDFLAPQRGKNSLFDQLEQVKSYYVYEIQEKDMNIVNRALPVIID